MRLCPCVPNKRSNHTTMCTLLPGMTALWTCSNPTVQIQVGLEFANKSPHAVGHVSQSPMLGNRKWGWPRQRLVLLQTAGHHSCLQGYKVSLLPPPRTRWRMVRYWGEKTGILTSWPAFSNVADLITKAILQEYSSINNQSNMTKVIPGQNFSQ